MRKIKLTGAKLALVDDEDFDKVNQFSWFINGKGYARTTVGTGWNRVSFYMHRFVLGVKNKSIVDHKNRNPLDNRKANLRECTNSQNLANARTPRTNTSGFKGVSWNKRKRKWEAYIKVLGKRRHLGYTLCKKDAARAYNTAARKYFGEFASINSDIEAIKDLNP